MDSFNQASTKEKFIKRIHSLSPNSKANWGKMNVAQMLNHLNDLFLIASEQKVVKEGAGEKILSIFVGGILKNRIIHSTRPFPKGIGNAPLPSSGDIDAEKKILLMSIAKSSPLLFTKQSLSIFGKMSPELWDKFLVRQFEPHLAQFSA